ncbi:hypothetical protein [uncultured Maribacter sp.]|uniref:hypothetical protein n=1 Tax=uncultured Maribacter sp. TaxID=431308 RepID=UPI00261C2650|nr:hypothetical protein [uncultured Maribacter sp.]
MRLVKEDILNIDRYLKDKGIKFLDVRYELIDHLVSEYEAMENYPDLESFLIKRVPWCKKVAEEKRKSIHWGYQKAFWTRLFSFLKKPMTCFFLIFWAVSLHILGSLLSPKVFNVVIISIFYCVPICQIGLFFYQRQLDGIKKKVLSYDTLFNIYSFPHLYMYFLPLIGDYMKSEPYWLAGYCTIGILLNATALIEVVNRRKLILKEYKFLKLFFS